MLDMLKTKRQKKDKTPKRHQHQTKWSNCWSTFHRSRCRQEFILAGKDTMCQPGLL